MTSNEFCRIAGRLMRQPAAPFHEHAVRAAVEQICVEHGLNFKRDTVGNVLVRLNTRPGTRPLVLAAHLDHPGFEIIRPKAAAPLQAKFLGGVPDEYFRPGTRLRLMPGGDPATLGNRIAKAKRFELRTNRLATSPRFAVWELDDFSLRRGHIYGRACDDLVGVATILATLIELKRSRAQVNVIGVIARAEEVGFLGAMAVAASRNLPKDSLVISLETSRELPGVKMGEGVILRVGDRTSIFDSTATRFLAEVGNTLKAKDRRFKFQRGLMSGGTCEATAYQEFGFLTAAVCVALGNYHNCGARKRIEPEYVSILDAIAMKDLLAAAARQMPRYAQLVARLPAGLRKMLRQSQRKLRTTSK